MSRPHWTSLRSQVEGEDRAFKLRHVLAWLFFIFALKWSLEFLWEAKQTGGFTLLPAVLLTWVCIITAGVCIENWLDGANKFLTFRLALIASALVSSVLWIWMLWQHAIFLLVGVMTFFRRPMQLLSLTALGEGTLYVSMGVVMFGLFAWFSIRLALALLLGVRNASVELVLGNQLFARPPAPAHLDPPNRVPYVGPAPRPAIKPPNRMVAGKRRPFPKALHTPVDVMPGLPAPTIAGKWRHLVRPPELGLAIRHPLEPSVLRTYAYRDGGGEANARECAGFGWTAFEWVLRAQPSMPEVADALSALPNIARSIDAADALEAREWISRLADHTGAFEVDLPSQEIADPYVRTRTVRIADVALQTLIDWDTERAKLPRQA